MYLADLRAAAPYYYNIYRAHKFKQTRVRGVGVARWGTWLAGKGEDLSFETVFKRTNGLDGNSLMFCGIKFQTVGAVNQKAL